jgi:outer membrane protein assembly factor BamB
MTKGVVVAQWGVGAAGYDMRTGKKLWQLGALKGCGIDGFVGGKALLQMSSCTGSLSEDGNMRYKAQELDPRTGKVQWTYRLAAGVDLAKIVSSKPAVLAIGAGDSKATDLISLNAQGKYRSTVRLEGGNYQVKCGDAVGACWGIVVGGDRVYVTSGEKLEEADNRTNWIVGFDLATGKTGVKFDAGEDQKFYPIRMSGDRLLAMQSGTDGVAPMSLVSLDPKSGKESTYFYFRFPEEAEQFGYFEDASEVVVEDGRVYFGVSSVTGNWGKLGGPNSERMAFGVAPAK